MIICSSDKVAYVNIALKILENYFFCWRLLMTVVARMAKPRQSRYLFWSPLSGKEREVRREREREWEGERVRERVREKSEKERKEGPSPLSIPLLWFDAWLDAWIFSFLFFLLLLLHTSNNFSFSCSGYHAVPWLALEYINKEPLCNCAFFL